VDGKLILAGLGRLLAIESAVLNRFRYVGSRDLLHARNIRNRARNLEYAMIRARG